MTWDGGANCRWMDIVMPHPSLNPAQTFTRPGQPDGSPCPKNQGRWPPGPSFGAFGDMKFPKGQTDARHRWRKAPRISAVAIELVMLPCLSSRKVMVSAAGKGSVACP